MTIEKWSSDFSRLWIDKKKMYSIYRSLIFDYYHDGKFVNTRNSIAYSMSNWMTCIDRSNCGMKISYTQNPRKAQLEERKKKEVNTRHHAVTDPSRTNARGMYLPLTSGVNIQPNQAINIANSLCLRFLPSCTWSFLRKSWHWRKKKKICVTRYFFFLFTGNRSGKARWTNGWWYWWQQDQS